MLGHQLHQMWTGLVDDRQDLVECLRTLLHSHLQSVEMRMVLQLGERPCGRWSPCRRWRGHTRRKGIRRENLCTRSSGRGRGRGLWRCCRSLKIWRDPRHQIFDGAVGVVEGCTKTLLNLRSREAHIAEHLHGGFHVRAGHEVGGRSVVGRRCCCRCCCCRCCWCHGCRWRTGRHGSGTACGVCCRGRLADHGDDEVALLDGRLSQDRTVREHLPSVHQSQEFQRELGSGSRDLSLQLLDALRGIAIDLELISLDRSDRYLHAGCP
mmetsp:Transcript_61337/g.163041  ORF Transcript_61337/g.163041 Transcript_61337/m.163041 type:complete len:266 (-) Transcript_61337:36-833(-)